MRLLLLPAVGMLVCLAMMLVVMPLGMRVARHIRDARAPARTGQHHIRLAGRLRGGR